MGKKRNDILIFAVGLILILVLIFGSTYYFSVAGIRLAWFQECQITGESYPILECSDCDFSSLGQENYDEFPTKFGLSIDSSLQRDFYRNILDAYFSGLGVNAVEVAANSYELDYSADSVSAEELQIMSEAGFSFNYDSDGVGNVETPIYRLNIDENKAKLFSLIERNCKVEGSIHERETWITQQVSVYGTWTEENQQIYCIVSENVAPDTTRPWDVLNLKSYFYSIRESDLACTNGEYKCEGFEKHICRNNGWVNEGISVGYCGVECIGGSECQPGETCNGNLCVSESGSVSNGIIDSLKDFVMDNILLMIGVLILVFVFLIIILFFLVKG